MGLDVAGVHVVWIFGVVVVTAAAVPVAMDAVEGIGEAREERVEAREAALASSTNLTRYIYDPVYDLVVLEMNNTGDLPLDLTEQAFLIDGVMYFGSSFIVEGRTGTTLWLPGEQANITITGVTTAPTRVLASQGSGTSGALALASEGQADEFSVRWQLGYAASNPRHFKAITLSSDGRSFSADAKLKGGGDTYIADVLRLQNPDDISHSIQLTATRDTNTYIEALEWRVMNGTTEVARLDFKVASPSATFTLSSEADFKLDLRMDLRDGAGKNNANGNFGLTMVVS